MVAKIEAYCRQLEVDVAALRGVTAKLRSEPDEAPTIEESVVAARGSRPIGTAKQEALTGKTAEDRARDTFDAILGNTPSPDP